MSEAANECGGSRSTPYGSRTRVPGLRIQCPGPLDEGGVGQALNFNLWGVTQTAPFSREKPIERRNYRAKPGVRRTYNSTNQGQLQGELDAENTAIEHANTTHLPGGYSHDRPARLITGGRSNRLLLPLWCLMRLANLVQQSFQGTAHSFVGFVGAGSDLGTEFVHPIHAHFGQFGNLGCELRGGLSLCRKLDAIGLIGGSRTLWGLRGTVGMGCANTLRSVQM